MKVKPKPIISDERKERESERTERDRHDIEREINRECDK